MGPLFAYSLAASLLLIPLYLSLRLMLHGHTFHRLYRVMMLSVLALSFALPLLMPAVRSWMSTSAGVAQVGLPVMDIDNLPVVGYTLVPDATPLWLSLLLIVYGAGVVVCLLCQLVRLGALLLFMSRCERVSGYGRWNVLVHDKAGMSPFSWGRSIVIGRRDFQSVDRTVMLHESAHLERRHWLDLLVVSLTGSVIWYNPAVWLLRRDMATIHEYEADSAVISSGADVRDYQIMLIKKAAGNRFHSIANSLDDKSNISKRVKMMLKKSSMPALRLRAALVVPVAALGLVALATPAVANVLGEVSDAKVTEVSAIGKTMAGEMAAPAGKEKVVTEQLLNTQTATAVVVTGADADPKSQPLVIIDGKVSDVKTLESVDPVAVKAVTVIKKEEALESYSQYPAAQNGVIVMELRDDRQDNGEKGKEVTEQLQTTKTVTVVAFADGNAAPESLPLVVVNGKVADPKFLKETSPESIKNITVLKDEDAKKQYGSYPAAKNGVLLVTLKEGDAAAASSSDEPLKVVAYGTTKKDQDVAVVGYGTKKKGQDDQAVDEPEELPVYPGGDAEMMMFIARNMTYPQEAVKNKEQGTVMVRFVINPDCSVSNVGVIKGVSESLDKEAMRVVSLLKFKSPGKNGGKAVPVNFVVPVRFKLQ